MLSVLVLYLHVLTFPKHITCLHAVHKEISLTETGRHYVGQSPKPYDLFASCLFMWSYILKAMQLHKGHNTPEGQRP